MTPLAVARGRADAPPRNAWSGRLVRAPLAAKLAVAFIGLVAFVLVVNGAIDTWLSYNGAKRAALELQLEKARSAADRVGDFLAEIETQLGWTKGVEWGFAPLEQRRYDFVRLLRQTPAIVALSYLDGAGKEQISVSRLEPDAIGAGKDYSSDPRFTRALAEKVWFGPVEFRRGSEPHMTVAMAHVGKTPGVTVADVNLKLIWDVVTAIRVGERGFAYVVDDNGRLLAHPDMSLVLRDTDLSRLPQVAEALARERVGDAAAPQVGAAEVATSLDGASVLTAYAVAPKTHWIVFVEQPLAEALDQAYRSAFRTLALLGLGLALAAISGLALARRMAAPIRLLQQGAEKLGAGDLAQRLSIRTGDEIEALAGSFNRMAASLQENYETLEARVTARTHDLEQALERQTATAEILKVIASSPSNAQPVFDAIAESANQLLGGYSATVYLWIDGDVHLVALTPTTPEADAAIRAEFPRPRSENLRVASIDRGETVEVVDTEETEPYLRDRARRRGFRSFVAVPLMSQRESIGYFTVSRREPGHFAPHQVQLLQTFADQAVIAIENVRLFEAVQARTRDLTEALQQQTATADVLKVISRSAFDLRAVLAVLVQSVLNLCDAPGGNIHLRHGETFLLETQVGFPEEFAQYMRDHPITPDAGTVSGRAILTGAVAQIPDVLEDPDYRLSEGVRIAGYRATLGVPLLRQSEVIGVFSVARPTPGPFTQRQIELVKTFADQAVIAIENVRLFDEVQARTRDLSEALQQQTATADVLKVISRSAFDLQAVLDTLISSAVELCGANRGAIYLRDGDMFRWQAATGATPEYLDYRRTNPLRAPGRGWVVGRVILSGRVESIPDVLDDKEFELPASALAGARAVLGVPMLRDGRVEGVVVLSRYLPGPFTQRQIELVETFADQAVIAIENVRLFEEVQARTRDLTEALQLQTATADVLKVISRTAFDLETVFDTLTSTAVRLCDASYGQIFRRHGDVYRYAASQMDVDPLYLRHEENVEIKAGRGTLVGRVALERRAVSVADAWSDPEYEEKDQARTGNVRAMLGVPLMRDGAPIGAFALARSAPNPFSERQIELVQTFADQAVIAIENVRLFDEVQARTRDLTEALQMQTATADVLKVISRSAFDVRAVLMTLVESARRLCNAQGAIIFLREGGGYPIAAQVGMSKEYEHYRSSNPLKASPTSAIGRALLTGTMMHVPDLLADPDEQQTETQRIAGFRAVLILPLLRDKDVIGLFTLNRPEPGAFTPAQINLVQTFTDQAAIALENVRLFDEVQARTRDLTEALQQQTATADVLKAISRTAFDLDTVLLTLITTAARLCNAHGGQIFRRHGEVYRYAASLMDVDPAYLEHERSVEIGPGRGTLIGRVALENRAVTIADAWSDPEYQEKDEARIGNVRAMLGVPLMRGGEPIGAFALARSAPIPFTQRQIELVTTFADQAVIAIENVRLFDEVQARTRDLSEALQQQTATAEVLKVISRSAFDLDAVLNSLTKSAAELCNATYGVISLYRDGILKFMAQSGCTPEFAELLWSHPAALDRKSMSGRAGLLRTVVMVPDVKKDEDYDFHGGEIVGNYRSGIGVPLLRNGELEGVFTLMRREPGTFTERQIELVQTFADQAVIAIENVRLFNEVQARTRDLTEALQQQTATGEVLKVISRSAFDLDTIFQTLVTTAVDLCKASSGTLCVRDGDVFRYRGMAGPESTPALQRYLEDHPLVAPSRRTAAGRAIVSRQIEQIPDVLREEDYAVPFAAHGSPARALLGVPLMGKTEVLGAIVVARAEPGEFPPRHVEILRTFADQAVIAIENSRLFEQVQSRTRELEQSLEDLRKAQDRLVQSEKLASLGQLTAGIAHEIKNPLNFVNNFASLSRELLDEMRETLAALPADARADADELMGMLDSNLDKVVHHGKRADSIVKNMLLHSREGSGERSRVNVNATVEEALSLGYHGARAEKPGFNIAIEKSLDPQAGEAKLYLQEITRVLLNLISNGFYATAKRKQNESGEYQPTLTASTRSLGERVEIRIRDNGTGIPAEVREKMFNPFFTTKPAGEGTGLGLSLSHDIVVKQHGGTLVVETEQGAFTEFIITLPRHGAEA